MSVFISIFGRINHVEISYKPLRRKAKSIVRIDISEQSEIVDKKERIEDREINLVIGKEHNGSLLTINDRATGLLFMGRLTLKNPKL